jgi:hypothetical protein
LGSRNAGDPGPLNRSIKSARDMYVEFGLHGIVTIGPNKKPYG